MHSNTQNYLVITAIGSDRPGIVNDLTKIVTDNHCNIEDSRMTILGGEFAIILLLCGNWSAIAKIEASLPKLSDKLELVINSKRTEARAKQPDLLNYHVETLSIDQPGIIHQVSEFFSYRGINIDALNTSAYNAVHTGTPMFALTMTINIPSSQSIAELREQFLDFCDERNMDGIIEAVRG